MTARPLERIAVLGAGAWGTALAETAARAGRSVTLWGHDPNHVAAIADRRENARHLPGVRLNARVLPEPDLARAAAGADALLLVTPAQALGATAAALAPHVAAGVPAVVCAKGFERAGRRLLCDVVAEALPQAVPAVLSGPSFAADVVRGLPTAVTIAAGDADTARALARALSHRAFRPYASTDLIGVQVGGAFKNVLALAVGIARGRGLGASAGAALVARGFAELVRLGLALGGRPETLAGLSGLGDLVLTAGSEQSRNLAHGIALGEGRIGPQETGDRLVEGVFTARVAVEIGTARGVELPIAAAVDAVLSGRLSIEAAIEGLLSRPLREEAESWSMDARGGPP